MNEIKEIFGIAALAMEAVGVAVVVLGSVYMVGRLPWRTAEPDRYGALRRDLGKSIILGLEFLIAGDIIRTVAVSHTIESVGVLAVIVLIRTFLSIALQYEIEGRLPWRRGRTTGR